MFLGIDLGTSGVKAAAINENGKLLDQATAPLTVQRTRALWSEQNPEEWISATEMAIQELRTKIGNLAAVRAIGLSGQMHGATLLNAKGDIIRPAILWNDGRSGPQCTTLEATEPQSRDITGNLAMPGFTAPKLLWVKEHEPENFKQIGKVLLPKDYLRFRLTGDYASDMSDSAGTLWLDVAKRQWSEAMLDACELDVSHMPALFEGPQVTGTLLPELAERWGMSAVPVAAGAGDNAAGAVGVGVTQAGDALVSLGTSGVFFVANAQYSPNPAEAVHAFCHCLPNTWHQMSVILSAASCLDWLANLTNTASVGDLLEELDRETPADNLPLFLPYLSGERTPHNNPHAKGVFFGLTHSTTRTHLTQAVLEGVAFAFADGQAALANANSKINSVSVIGGGSRSRRWQQILANVLNRPLQFRRGGDVGPALGAARLAELAYLQSQGDYSADALESVCPKPEIDAEVSPDAESSARYQDKWAQYRQLYRDTQSFMSAQ